MTISSQPVQRAEKIYVDRWKAESERTYPDYFLAIEPDSETYYLGRTLSEAATAARLAYPGRWTYILRVGHPVTVYIGGGG